MDIDETRARPLPVEDDRTNAPPAEDTAAGRIARLTGPRLRRRGMSTVRGAVRGARRAAAR